MVKRSKGWDEHMLEDLNDPSFTRELLLAAVDDGVPFREALGDIIRGIGVKEFASRVGMPGPHLVRAVDPAHNPTQETLERLLRPFGLRLGLTPIQRRKRTGAVERRRDRRSPKHKR
jgi:DNA-binding phage protein